VANALKTDPVDPTSTSACIRRFCTTRVSREGDVRVHRGDKPSRRKWQPGEPNPRFFDYPMNALLQVRWETIDYVSDPALGDARESAHA
jgi:hypothetical protein